MRQGTGHALLDLGIVIVVSGGHNDPVPRLEVGNRCALAPRLGLSRVLPRIFIIQGGDHLVGLIAAKARSLVDNRPKRLETEVIAFENIFSVPLTALGDEVLSALLALCPNNCHIAALADDDILNGAPQAGDTLMLLAHIQGADNPAAAGIPERLITGLIPVIYYIGAAGKNFPPQQSFDHRIGRTVRVVAGNICTYGATAVQIGNRGGDPQHIASFVNALKYGTGHPLKLRNLVNERGRHGRIRIVSKPMTVVFRLRQNHPMAFARKLIDRLPSEESRAVEV